MTPRPSSPVPAAPATEAAAVRKLAEHIIAREQAWRVDQQDPPGLRDGHRRPSSSALDLARSSLALVSLVAAAEQQRDDALANGENILPGDEVCACLSETGERRVRIYERCERCRALMESDAHTRAEAAEQQRDEAQGEQRVMARNLTFDAGREPMFQDEHGNGWVPLARFGEEEDRAEAAERRAAETEAALEHISEQQQKTLEMIRHNGFVFDDIGKEPGNWQHLAFTIYTDLCEVDSIARAALSAGGPERNSP